ncbi:MAG: hypothetical protein IH959_08345 [Chloroflexi bacterium]|nr:hypothetical protein [Chloroflexota bacterium]
MPLLSRRVVLSALLGLGLVASLVVVRLLLSSPQARALPAAGEDLLSASASASIVSRLGQETIAFTGTIAISREDPRLENGVEVVDLVITSLNLTGQSLAGLVTVGENAGLPSTGEFRSLSADQFPASSFFDIFVDLEVPASPAPTNPLSLHNEVALHLVPDPGGTVDAWPPLGVTYRAQPDPCVPLVPLAPAEVCVTSLAVTLLEAAPKSPSYSLALGNPSGVHPADLLALSPSVPVLPTPTNTLIPPATSTPFGTPTATPTPAPGTVFGNDNFADAWEISGLPFTGAQNTEGMTTEVGEPLSPETSSTNPSNCILATPNEMGATVWYQFTPSESGVIFAETDDSNFDTVLAVYTGSAIDALTVVICNDDRFGLQSEVTFQVTAGTTYYLQVGGFSTNVGDLVLALSINMGGASGFASSVHIACTNLGLTVDGCDDGTDGTQDDLDALSWGADFTPAIDMLLAFSVAPGSDGLPGSAVAAQAACTPAQPQADEFSTTIDGTNIIVFDGDGLNSDCPGGLPIGLIEQPESDDLNALTNLSPSVVDTNGDGVPDQGVYFSLAAGSPSLTELALSAADILRTNGGAAPTVFAGAAALGLAAGDDVDAFCLSDRDVVGVFAPETDTVYFSLAAGSPALVTLGASPADILGPGPVVIFAAAELGLQDGDDLNALKCFVEAPPTPTPTSTRTPTVTPTPTPLPADGDVNDNGVTDSIDAVLILQFDARLLPALPNPSAGDVNLSGEINSIDATLVLQFVAGLIPRLPI